MNDVAGAAGSTARDLQNRAKGLAHYAAGAVAKVVPWSVAERRMPPRVRWRSGSAKGCWMKDEG